MCFLCVQLARSEWLKFIAVFFNRAQAANAITAGIQARYNATAAQVLAKPPSVSTSAIEPPVVAWLSIYSGTVTVSTTALRQAFTADAGGKLFVPPKNSYSDMDEFRRGQSSRKRHPVAPAAGPASRKQWFVVADMCLV